MEFSPQNAIVRLCLAGMEQETNGDPVFAKTLFMEAWSTSTNDFEKFISAYYVARHQTTPADNLHWLQLAMEFALSANTLSASSALPNVYAKIASCYAEIADDALSLHYRQLSEESAHQLPDKGPFYHGTRADLQTGDELLPGNRSNYQSDIIMNHIYFTALLNGAGLAAALAKGEGRERVYIVEPTGDFENDPNVTDKKFPGNPTRSYRTTFPLRIIGEVMEWERQTPEQIQQWKDRLAKNSGEIIN